MNHKNSINIERKNLVSMIKQDSYRMDILKATRKITNQELWVAGGFVRNLVWDKLHGFKHRTELGDVDVFYFDQEKTVRLEEKKIKDKLLKLLPNVNWSVKNQARMHFHDKNIPYLDLSDSLTKFPEIASAVAVRLSKNNKIEVLAPLGLSDLFALKVNPTQNGKTNKLTYRSYLIRQKEKNWKKIWNQLDIDK